jgi:hypothetical protein
VVLFDTASGGAGFVHEVREHFIDVIKGAWKLVDCTSCGDTHATLAYKAADKAT